MFYNRIIHNGFSFIIGIRWKVLFAFTSETEYMASVDYYIISNTMLTPEILYTIPTFASPYFVLGSYIVYVVFCFYLN